MKIYIVGIGGAGTSALAQIYHEKGFEVSGSDDGDSFYIGNLRKSDIKIFDNFDELHLSEDIDLVVHTTAIKKNNIELQSARELNLNIKNYPEAVGELTKQYKTIAVCGTHGKTTTTALTTYGLIGAKLQPTALVGSKISEWGSGAYVGGEEYFVLEADEYQNKLAFYNPFGVILTSVDFDHPDFFEDFEGYKKVFADFVTRIPKNGFLVACGDDDDVRDVALSAKTQVFFYGEKELNNCRIIQRETIVQGQKITVEFRNQKYEIKTQLFGLHNANNVVASWLASFLISNNATKSAQGVWQCSGTARRFEKKGLLNGAVLIDDYAHHPKEIEATLKTAKEVFQDKNIIVAFHPHTFSRTKALLDEFATSLSLADEVIVLDIFASARETTGNITSQDLVDKIRCDKKQNIHNIEDLANWMENNLTENDVFITMGAGDIYKVYDLIKK
jgi:UDP-N-acetylmuramate--alanine ligase